MVRTLDQMNGSVALAITGEDQLLGALVLRDERLREAYSSEEIELFRGVALSIGVTLQNSQVYERMKERDRLAALGQMAAGLAHEIRNPLGAIKGAAQLLQPSAAGHTGVDPAGTKEFLSIIVEEVNRLNKIVSQFLDYARPYRGEQEPLDVNDVVRKTLQLLAKEAEGMGMEVVPSLVDGLPPVRADAEQLVQVFLNLSLNALQAMPDGGRLFVSSAIRRATRRGAAAAFLEVRFRDTGVGIPPATCATCSSRSSPRRRRAPASGCPSASASSRTTAAPSRCVRRPAWGRRSRSCCRSSRTPTRRTSRRSLPCRLCPGRAGRCRDRPHRCRSRSRPGRPVCRPPHRCRRRCWCQPPRPERSLSCRSGTRRRLRWR